MVSQHPTPTPIPAPSAPPPSAALSPELAQLLRPLFSGAAPGGGIAVAVIRGGERTVVCRGYADRSGSRPVRADTRFALGSVTKTFTGLLLAEMVARGEVSYEDPIDRYLPADALPGYPQERPITLLHLATHTSGLPRLPVGLTPAAVPRWFTDPYASFSRPHLLRALPRTPVRGMPGAQYRYSSLGCGLLGLALENAAGLRYEELLAGRVCGPLGLVDTSCAEDREPTSGYRRGRRVSSFRLPALPGAAALSSTADDMLRYLQAHLAVDAVPIPERGGAAAALRSALRDVRLPRVERRRGSGGRGGVRIALTWNQRPVEDGELLYHAGSTGSARGRVGRGDSAGSGAPSAVFAGFNPVAQVGLVAMASTLPGLRRRFTQTAYGTLRRLAAG
ncbi:serine hydrolase domain-containing protein [Kitasatospora sp. NPDC051853]|uniref:serine hydrolase domain-containing protein n=1 Tax=Kitasatospora sp. NPDC051853 TaxID=3364058 RepID=UPI0037ABE5A7